MPSAVVSTMIPTGIINIDGAVDIAEIRQFVITREARLGYRPLSDQAWADLTRGPEHRLVAVQLIESGATIGYAQATTETDAQTGPWNVEVVLGDDADQVIRLGRQLLAAVVLAVLDNGGTSLGWLVQGPSSAHDEIAASFGLDAGRRLHQMRRTLPTGLDYAIEIRPFDPELDVDEWLLVNSRAFAKFPDQGGWTESKMRARMDEPWFDPAGFLVHERVDSDGSERMAGFCWTKIWDGMGEIYVIAVDPDFHGIGLGRALTLAGLDSLSRRGITTGMLFVDADNVAAVHLYDRLGFAIHRTDCLYSGQIVPTNTETRA